MTGFLHHIDLTVTDVAKSKPLYDIFLEHAGFTLKSAGEDWAGYGLGDKRYPCITILKATSVVERAHDRYTPGLHHLALRAKSQADVDALYAKLKAAKAQILDPPADYPDYGKGYYALFFADPDGIKLEYVFTPPEGEVRVAP